MSKKDKKTIFYSTNPDAVWHDEDEESAIETLAPAQQKLRIVIDRKQRKGKEVTLITGFIGKEEDLNELGKTLKTKCGVGGSVKDMEIILQGNWVQKATELLKAMGYKIS